MGDGENGSEAEKKGGDERDAIGLVNGVGRERKAVRGTRRQVIERQGMGVSEQRGRGEGERKEASWRQRKAPV